MRKVAFYGLVIGLWMFLMWASCYSALTDDRLFFRPESLNVGHYILAFLFRLFRKPFLFVLPSFFALIIWGIWLFWVWMKPARFWVRFLRLIQFLLFLMLILASVVMQFHPYTLQIFGYYPIYPRMLTPGFLFKMSLTVFPFLLISELLLMKVERTKFGAVPILAGWLRGLYFVIIAVSVIFLSLYFIGWNMEIAILEFPDYFLRLIPFLGAGLAMALVWWLFPALQKAKGWGEMRKMLLISLVLTVLFCLPAYSWIQRSHKKFPAYPGRPPGIARIHAMIYPEGITLKIYTAMHDSFMKAWSNRLPADLEPSLKRFHLSEPLPGFTGMKRHSVEYPAFREYFIRKATLQPYKTSAIWGLVLQTFSQNDPFLSREEAKALWEAFMMLKDTDRGAQARYIEFAFHHQVPSAQQAEESFQRRVNRQMALFPKARRGYGGAPEEHKNRVEVAKEDAFSIERAGKVSGKVEFMPGVLKPDADVRRVWVSVSPRVKNLFTEKDEFPTEVTHFPLNADGSFLISSLPYRTYRLLLNLPEDILTEPSSTSLAHYFLPEIQITAENPEATLGTIRIVRAIQVLTKSPARAGEVLEWEPYPGAVSYEISFCESEKRSAQQYSVFYAWFRYEVSCKWTKEPILQPQTVKRVSYTLPSIPTTIYVVIRALDNRGNSLSSSLPLFFSERFLKTASFP